MGNGIVVGHIRSAHDGFPPTPVTAGSGSVKIDGIPAARQGTRLHRMINRKIQLTRAVLRQALQP